MHYSKTINLPLGCFRRAGKNHGSQITFWNHLIMFNLCIVLQIILLPWVFFPGFYIQKSYWLQSFLFEVWKFFSLQASSKNYYHCIFDLKIYWFKICKLNVTWVACNFKTYYCGLVYVLVLKKTTEKYWHTSLHVHVCVARPCWFCMSMSMLNIHVPLTMLHAHTPLSLLHVRVHIHAANPC